MSNAVGYLHRIAFILLFVQASKSAVAQQNWFLYIQSETSQSFYVRIGETIYSSSPVGHLIINGLRDSTYRLAIGFPQSQYREHQFAVPVGKKDHGFELKKSDARSWVLYEWQTQETISSPRTDSLLYGERKKDDGFASLMAAVVKDSAVLYTSVVKTEPSKKPVIDSALIVKNDPVVKKMDSVVKDTALVLQEKKPADVIVDSAIAKTEIQDSAKTETALVILNPPTKPDSVLKDSAKLDEIQLDTTAVAVTETPIAVDKTPTVAKFYEQTVNNEKKIVFLDNTIGIKKDTITVIIPLEKDSAIVEDKALAKSETPKQEAKDMAKQVDTSETKAVAKEEQSKTTQPLMDSIATMQPVDSSRLVKAEMQKLDSVNLNEAVKEPEPEKPSGLVLINSDCAKFATDNDVDKLRVKMLKEKDAGNRIYIAHKAFKDMCFATRQIKALSELFPSDELKFRFFETAWPFVSDTAVFKSLEEMLTDPFFVTRFRTLLKR